MKVTNECDKYAANASCYSLLDKHKHTHCECANKFKTLKCQALFSPFAAPTVLFDSVLPLTRNALQSAKDLSHSQSESRTFKSVLCETMRVFSSV